MHTSLQRISNNLMINGGYMNNLGLYSGDMGIVLFFYRYARLLQNEIYSEYSAGLLEIIRNKIRSNTPVNYKQGLSGIGSTIEYLAQNDYTEDDTDGILENFDKRIFFTYNLSYLSIDKIVDIGYYALWRLSGKSDQKEMIYTSVMPEISSVMEEWQTSQDTINPTASFFREIILSKNHVSKWSQLCRENNTHNVKESFTFLIEQFSDKFSTKNDFDLGVQYGLAGLGLSIISELDGDDSWLSLFPNDLIPSEK